MNLEIRNKTDRLVAVATLKDNGTLKNWMFAQKAAEKDKDSWFNFVGKVRRGEEPDPSTHGLRLVFSEVL